MLFSGLKDRGFLGAIKQRQLMDSESDKLSIIISDDLENDS